MARGMAQLVHQYVGKKALLRTCDSPESRRTMDNGDTKTIPAVPGILVPVWVVNVRVAYGREHLLVRPLRGRGSVWVEASDRVVVLADDDDWPEERPFSHEELEDEDEG